MWEDGERVIGRARRAEGAREWVLVVAPAAERPSPGCLERLAHEYALKDELDASWSARPLELRREGGQTLLVLEDAGGEPLERLLGAPMAVERFLRLAIAISAALGKVHQRGLVHKDAKPANILVDCADGRARLTGFGVASRLPHERQAPEPPEIIAGTLAYMAPEQTGRMNRSIDWRSDFYALGVTLYQMLTGRLPFSATDPMEWVHCHIARMPTPPAERQAGVPIAVSDIVMKLLAKTAEERYQTAAGLEHDLRRCLAEWERCGRVEPFALGERDTPDQLLTPGKLYGREREIERLFAAFDRVAATDASELVLVSGYSGVGKSSVVNELHKRLVARHGLFAAGKFDRLKRDIPYATLAQAFQSLVRSLLGKSEEELAGWREALREALGPNGRLIADLVPELTLVIGEQPPVAALESQQEKGRFQLVFRRFISAFATAEHPLALFLDDLQWLDAATLDLMEDLLSHADVRRLLLIGAYRVNEVDAAHPLSRKLAAMRSAGAPTTEIQLKPLDRGHIKQLIADALCSTPEEVAPLAALTHAKTGGNPFFALQFLHALTDERLLAFDHDAQRWTWDLDRIRTKGYADNVVDLMVAKLSRLPSETQKALQQLACLGVRADAATLAVMLETTEDEVHAALWEAVRGELLERQPGGYRFAHDRVQEAAYSLVPTEQRAETHLRIGRLLVAHVPAEKQEEAVFDIVNQLNRGSALIVASDERERLAELNLTAGRRAKASAAYASALSYIAAGAALLPEDVWERRRDFAFQLELNRAECEFLTGALADAEQRLAALAPHAGNVVEAATTTCLRIDVCMALDHASRAVEVGLAYLRDAGFEWSPHPADDDVRREYERIWAQLGGRKPEELVDMPLMTDPTSLAILDVLIRIVPPAVLTNANLASLITFRSVNLSLEQGNCDASCYAYAQLAAILGPRGHRFAKLGLALITERGLRRFEARIWLQYGYLALWSQQVRVGREALRRAFDTAIESGDLTNAAYACDKINTNYLAAGDPLSDAQKEAENGLAFARKARVGFIIDVIAAQLGLIRTLRGLTPRFGSLEHEQLAELETERRFSQNPDLAMAECWYWVRKLQASFFAGDYAAANLAASRAQRLLWTSPGQFETAEYHLYAALSLAASSSSLVEGDRAAVLEALSAHSRQLEMWVEGCAENFENRAALVAAEIARLEGRPIDAERHYGLAIRSARTNGFVHNRAVANELAARFYLERGLEDIAHMHMQKARYCYQRWGAEAKVRQLDDLYPHVALEDPTSGPTSTIEAPLDHLDLATVVKISQASAGELVLDRLLESLMRMAVQQAGAERGLLVLRRGDEFTIEAEATTSKDAIVVQLGERPANAAALPASILHYVVRTRENVILDDAATQAPFADDPYVRQHRTRSVLCAPMINQGQLLGILYLENSLASSAFPARRITVVKLIASQAAIALENTRLYRDLAEREARIRRLVDANIIGIFTWQLPRHGLDVEDLSFVEVNDAFLRIVGYERQEFDSSRMRWADLTPPEWRERDARTIRELREFGVVQPYEKEYFCKDGGRVSVLLAAASFDDGTNQGVSFVLDLTERKRAEEALRQMQAQLAHANRIETMGQLTASIAHEVSQPISATVANAQAALRYMDRPTPNLDEVRLALGRIVRDGDRASAVVGRIRGLIKQTPPRNESVEINSAIREVIEFTRVEASKNGVAVRTELAEQVPIIQGDRIELQQVLLNLVVNAVDAMSAEPGPRELLIGTGQTEAGDVLVSVRDTGPGISPAALERLFKAFYTTKSNGLGLGLSISRSIVEAHGGRLWVSANEPRGAVFQFTLPFRPEGAQHG